MADSMHLERELWRRERDAQAAGSPEEPLWSNLAKQIWETAHGRKIGEWLPEIYASVVERANATEEQSVEKAVFVDAIKIIEEYAERRHIRVIPEPVPAPEPVLPDTYTEGVDYSMLDLPREIERKCCPGKPGCGNVTLRLFVYKPSVDLLAENVNTDPAPRFEYRRDNGFNGYYDGDVYAQANSATDLFRDVSTPERMPWTAEELEKYRND